jgi:hypothetical protein
MRAKTVVATRAGSARGRVAEVSQHEGPTARPRVGVLLHHVELREVGLAATVEQGPVDRISVEPLRAVREAAPTT